MMALRDLAYGFWASQCLYVVAELGIAERLADGPKKAAELADLAHCHAGALERVLRALATIGVLRRSEDGSFALTPQAELLRARAEGSVHAEVPHLLDPSCWGAWGRLLHSVRTGEAAFPAAFGTDAWTYRARHPEVRAVFDRMATAASKRRAAALDERIDLAGAREIVDVGGGTGALLDELLAGRPTLRGVLLDLPEVVAGAGDLLAAAGVADRCRVGSGSFIEEVPAGGDVYLLKAILHDWNDEAAIAILATCRRAMGPDARLWVIESLLDTEATATPSVRAHLMDLHMLVMHGGRERSAAELAALLEAAGFRPGRIAIAGPGAGPSAIEGVPAPVEGPAPGG